MNNNQKKPNAFTQAFHKINWQIIYLVVLGLLIPIEIALIIPTLSGIYAENGIVVNVFMFAIYGFMFMWGKIPAIERPKNLVPILGIFLSPFAVAPLVGNILHLTMAILLIITIRKAYIEEVTIKDEFSRKKKEVDDGVVEEIPSVFDDFDKKYNKLNADEYEIDEKIKRNSSDFDDYM